LESFSWTSSLGLGVALFLAAGAFQVLICVLTAAFVLSGGGGNALFFTERSDTGAYGKPPAEIVASEPGVDTYRHVVWLTWAAFLGAVGVMEAAVAWFGLREGASWALAVLAVEAVLLAVFWAAIIGIYLGKGAAVSLGDVPPLMWLTMALHAPALVLAWRGLS